MIAWKRSSPPDPIITDEELIKKHLRLDPDDTYDDALIALYQLAAIDMIERYLGFPIVIADLEANVTIEEQDIEVIAHLSDIEATSGGDTVDITTYTRNYITYINTATLAEDEELTFTMQAGYVADEASVPASLKTAILMLMSQMYEKREPTLMTMPDTVIHRLEKYMIY